MGRGSGPNHPDHLNWNSISQKPPGSPSSAWFAARTQPPAQDLAQHGRVPRTGPKACGLRRALSFKTKLDAWGGSLEFDLFKRSIQAIGRPKNEFEECIPHARTQITLVGHQKLPDLSNPRIRCFEGKPSGTRCAFGETSVFVPSPRAVYKKESKPSKNRGKNPGLFFAGVSESATGAMNYFPSPLGVWENVVDVNQSSNS